MTDVPEGFNRGKDGILRWEGSGFGRRHYREPDEAIKTLYAGKERIGCNESVMSNLCSHPCGKAPKYDPDANGNPTKCGHHSAAAKARRKAKRDAANEAEKARWRQKRESAEMAKEAQEIVCRIAEGYNDPRSLCMDWVARKQEFSE